MSSLCGESSIDIDMSSSASSCKEEETVAYESLSSGLNAIAVKPLPPLPFDDEHQNESSSSDDDITATSSASSSSSNNLSYFQKLALKLRSHNNNHNNFQAKIRIISDNPKVHSRTVNGQTRLSFPSLGPAAPAMLDEYNALNEFMPALLKEKGLVPNNFNGETLSIVCDNASSWIPSSLSSLPTNDSCQELLPIREQQDNDEVVDLIVEQHSSCASSSTQQHEMTRVGRSYSLDGAYSTPKQSKAKRSLTRALSFQGGSSKQHSMSDKSPQSVLDIFNPLDTEELRISFDSL
mmetsp:Transcript_640/g.1112  ORF Transcript_640/g.1112 Transcript_640/m.1112 type:complete len:293 (-) Transcript_640:51-929(-)